ncbi:MAG: right-handed parallel beta-helix repeat-containing protein [Planctomycetes bacterium]|nr:right-handed parallel beta-helix repeat-containing protein [Planctomycetota bacterium]
MGGALPIAVCCFLVHHWWLGAGEIDPPPGPITATGRFGPRIEVNQLPGDGIATHIITAPGSYYLSGNIAGESGKSGIDIRSGNVTLDLNGFALIGVAGSGSGIVGSLATTEAIVIRNGTIDSWGDRGISLGGTNIRRVDSVMVRNNGNYGIQIQGGFGHLIRNCTVIGNGQSVVSGGIFSSENSLLIDCTARENVGIGITAGFCNITNCNSFANTVSDIDGVSSLVRSCAFGVGGNLTGASLIDNL